MVNESKKQLELQLLFGNIMHCWICGKHGDTREHMIKASDITLYLPGIAPQKPAFIHNNKAKNILVRSKKAKILKSNTKICNECNSSRTQKHDLAWEAMSSYIHNNLDHIIDEKKIYLNRVFKVELNENAKNVQLYFLKLFGCLLNDTSHAVINVLFADSITKSRICKDVYFDFCISKKYIIGRSHLYVDYEVNQKTLSRAQWEYRIGYLWIRVYYIDPNHYELETPIGWNPSKRNFNIIDIQQL